MRRRVPAAPVARRAKAASERRPVSGLASNRRVCGAALKVATLCLATLLAAGCGRDGARGFLFARFADEGPIFRARIDPPSAEDKYLFNYELRQGDTVCRL